MTSGNGRVWFEVNHWSSAPMNGEWGELLELNEGDDYPVVLYFGGDKRNKVAYRVEDVTFLHRDKVYPY